MLCAVGLTGCDDDGASGSPEPSLAATTPTPDVATIRAAGAAARDAGGGTSVMLFSIGDASARRLDDVPGVAFAEWFDGGTKFVGYDWNENAYKIIDLDGTTVATFGQEAAGNRRNSFITAANDGTSVLLHREDSGADVLLSVMSGEERAFAPGSPAATNGGFEFSPNGSQVAFNRVVDDRASVYLADSAGENARPLLSAQYASVGIAGGHAWSPDGRLLLVEERHVVDACLSCWSNVVIDLEGNAVWTMPGLSDDAVLIDVRWAGAGRLLVTKNQIVDDGSIVAESVTLVDLASGGEREVDPGIAQRFLSLSPDGDHAITRLGDGARWEEYCALVAIDWDSGELTEIASIEPAVADFETVFCTTVDWSSDGTKAIVSASGI